MRHLLAVALAAVAIAAVPALAGPENVKFPQYAKGVQYFTLDKFDDERGHTVRKFFVTKGALAALKAGKALPSGTVLTREDWFVKLDAEKRPVKDAHGRFIATRRKAVHVMEKHTGWGAEYPDKVRNGNWEYASFRPDGARNAEADVMRCFGCHKSKAKDDYVFSLIELRAAAK